MVKGSCIWDANKFLSLFFDFISNHTGHSRFREDSYPVSHGPDSAAALLESNTLHYTEAEPVEQSV